MPNRDPEQLDLELPPPLDWPALRVIMGARQLTSTEKLLLQRIWSFDGRRFGKHRACYASNAFLADELGTPVKTVERVVAELIYVGLIRSRRQGHGRMCTIALPRDAFPRSSEPDDLLRARNILDVIVQSKRNDFEEWRHRNRKSKPSPARVDPSAEPSPVRVLNPHQRGCATSSKRVVSNPPHHSTSGEILNEANEPHSIAEILREMRNT